MSRRRQNDFDTDVVHIPASADTSISSVSTEPHSHHEPTSRRRVSPINTSSMSHHTIAQDLSGAGLVATPLRKQNNPYQYNVLGENASPDFQARTSPIPRTPSPPNFMTAAALAPHHAMGVRNLSMEWDQMDEPTSPNTTVQHVVHPLTAPATPVIGGYMAAAYSSAFPPGKLPRADEFPAPAYSLHHQQQQGSVMQQQPMFANGGSANAATNTSSPGASSGRQSTKKRRAAGRGGSPLSASASGSIPAPASASKSLSPPQRGEEPPRDPTFSTPAPQSPTMAASPMTRVYINGRPIPVPAAAAAVAA